MATDTGTTTPTQIAIGDRVYVGVREDLFVLFWDVFKRVPTDGFVSSLEHVTHGALRHADYLSGLFSR